MKTRKLFSRIMAAVFAMILVLGMNLTALADSPLTVNGTKAGGGNVTAYKLFDRTEQTIEGKKAVAYTLNSKYKEFFTQEGKVGYGKTGDALSEAAYNYVAGLAEDARKVELSQFAADMWKWISENGKVADETAKAADTATTMTLGAGYYLIFPAGAATLIDGNESPAILQDVDGTTDVSVNLKSKYPTLDKKVTTPGGLTPEYTGTVKPGDTVTYTITSKVPDVSGYTKGYKFVIKDTLSPGLTFNANSVSVKIGENALRDANYTLIPDTTSNSFTLELKNMTKDDGGKQVPNTDIYPTGKTITLTYTATVNEKAVTGIDPNTNKAKVEYSNKPGEEGTGESEEVEAKVYTFEFGIFKYSLKDGTVDEASNRNPLANAQFKLYADTEHHTEIKLVAVAGTGTDKVYRQAKADEVGVDYIETDATGKVTIKGLKEGIYYLSETKAPAGFNKLVGDIKVEINNLKYDTTDTTKLNSYEVTYTMPGKTSGTTVKVETSGSKAEIPVLNKAGSTLPSTGGMGTVVFTIAGAAIIGLMLVSSLVSKKRKRSE